MPRKMIGTNKAGAHLVAKRFRKGQGSSNENNPQDRGIDNANTNPVTSKAKNKNKKKEPKTELEKIAEDPDYIYRSKLATKHPEIGFGFQYNPKDENSKIPVRKIYINNLGANIQNLKLRKVFSQYGKIKQVKVIDKDNYSFAFILFEYPKDAEKALRTPTIINGRLLTVREAAPQHQIPPSPDLIDRLYSIAAPDKCYLDNLNNDCLRQIFSYFNFVERNKYESVCRRWKDLIREMWLVQRKLDFTTDPLRRLVINKVAYDIIFKILIKRVGSSLLELSVNNFESLETFYELRNFCKNIEILRLYNFNFGGPDHFYHIIFKSVKSLTLNNCYLPDNTVQQKLFSSMKNLEHFTLIHPFVNASDMFFVQNLKSLTLHKIEFTFKHFENCLQNSNKKLVKLDLKHCKVDMTFLENSIQEIVKSAPNLEELKISYFIYPDFVLDDIAKLANLRKLCLNRIPSLNNTLVKNITRACTQLEHVELNGNIQLTTDAYITLGKLTKLSYLAICQCPVESVLTKTTGLTNEGLIQLVNNLKNPGSLKHLYCSYASATDEAFYCVLTICRSLETLNITCCLRITEATLMTAEEAVASRNNDIPLKIDIKGIHFENMEHVERMSKNGLIITTDGCPYSDEMLVNEIRGPHFGSDDSDDDDDDDDFDNDHFDLNDRYFEHALNGYDSDDDFDGLLIMNNIMDELDILDDYDVGW